MGYQLEDGDNHNCQNIDECEEESDKCGLNQVCTDTDGSYNCLCKPGHREVQQFECEDIDECTNSDHGCDQVCNNTQGGFICSCEEGYERTDDACTGE